MFNKEKQEVIENPASKELDKVETTEQDRVETMEQDRIVDGIFSVTYELDGIRYQIDELSISQEQANEAVRERVCLNWPGHKVVVLT
jgi:hypothetical protein